MQKTRKTMSLPHLAHKLPHRALEQQDIVDEIGRAILRTNGTLIEATLRFAQFNCTQKMRCSPDVFGEACARFGIATVKSRTHLLTLYAKRAERHPFQRLTAVPPYITSVTPRDFERGAQDPAHFARKPWLDDRVACFNVCAYILRWAATVGWSKINGHIFKLWQDAASMPVTDEVVTARTTAFYRLFTELTRGTIPDAWTLPGKWVRDIFLSAIVDDVAPKENWKDWIRQQSELGRLLGRRQRTAIELKNHLQRVTEFCAANSHTLDLNALVPWVTTRATKWVRPITLALLLDNEPVAMFLIRQGVDINLWSESSPDGAVWETPLLAAASWNLLTLNGVLLLANQPSIDLSATCTQNRTILHRLVSTLEHTGHELDEVARALLVIRQQARVLHVNWNELVRVEDVDDRTALFYYNRLMAERRSAGTAPATRLLRKADFTARLTLGDIL